MNLQEQISRMKSMMGLITESNDSIERLYIDWDENYGNSFKIVHTPEGAQTGGEWNPDLISIVTPENTNAWYEWEELPEEKLMGWKENWDTIQKGLGDHKYNQIVRSMSNNQQEIKEGEDANLEDIFVVKGTKKPLGADGVSGALIKELLTLMKTTFNSEPGFTQAANEIETTKKVSKKNRPLIRKTLALTQQECNKNYDYNSQRYPSFCHQILDVLISDSDNRFSQSYGLQR
ncbi:MAG: hypothetical protein ACO3UU_11240 [Minisyncoccia bacterium]